MFTCRIDNNLLSVRFQQQRNNIFDNTNSFHVTSYPKIPSWKIIIHFVYNETEIFFSMLQIKRSHTSRVRRIGFPILVNTKLHFLTLCTCIVHCFELRLIAYALYKYSIYIYTRRREVNRVYPYTLCTRIIFVFAFPTFIISKISDKHTYTSGGIWLE